jgi:hypothetical protein
MAEHTYNFEGKIPQLFLPATVVCNRRMHFPAFFELYKKNKIKKSIIPRTAAGEYLLACF